MNPAQLNSDINGYKIFNPLCIPVCLWKPRELLTSLSFCLPLFQQLQVQVHRGNCQASGCGQHLMHFLQRNPRDHGSAWDGRLP